ncbi:carboxymethylenebutenolidase [Gemmobacter aquaticus]|uniref:Carboxymethylenebutenolidase n=2 Tax=Gemmobacter aquaticus TaxID=490185 RepID=A0A917YQF5_9RHOB|nr:dienelactone hydrolase family protein [Gemmobacter aquaticus]GGO38444.1 carboxymethylenebutenolidase [Gemmobacter aquaticus]
MVTVRDLAYSHDGCEMRGLFHVPHGASNLPGVLVVHGAHGLGDFIRASSERLAREGYAVLAVDMWGGRKLLTDPALIGPQLGAFVQDRGMWMGRLAAAQAALATQPETDAARIGAIGYCFGGASVLEMLRTGAALAGVVSLHGGLDVVGDDWAGAQPGEALICTGADDPLASPTDLARITAGMGRAALDWQADVYGGTLHGFTEPDAPGRPPFARYNARADRRSWAATVGFLAEVLC